VNAAASGVSVARNRARGLPVTVVRPDDANGNHSETLTNPNGGGKFRDLVLGEPNE
jgi:hypothetical protein